jgi:hypothetical protein
MFLALESWVKLSLFAPAIMWKDADKRVVLWGNSLSADLAEILVPVPFDQGLLDRFLDGGGEELRHGGGCGRELLLNGLHHRRKRTGWLLGFDQRKYMLPSRFAECLEKKPSFKVNSGRTMQ